jgi:hypothetical protein
VIERATSPVQQGIPTSKSDQFKITVYSSVSNIQIGIYTIMWANGQIQRPSFAKLASASYGSIQTTTIELTEGVLIGADVFIISSGSPVPRGVCFVRGSVVRSIGTSVTFEYANVVSNYLTSTIPITYPTTPLIGSIDGSGVKTLVGSGSVAGNVPASFTVPTGVRWRLIGIISVLTTDAVVANRTVVVQPDIARSESGVVQTASISNRNYYFYNGFQSTVVSASGFVYVQLPPNLFLDSGTTINQTITNGDAGDTHSFTAHVEELQSAQ